MGRKIQDQIFILLGLTLSVLGMAFTSALVENEAYYRLVNVANLNQGSYWYGDNTNSGFYNIFKNNSTQTYINDVATTSNHKSDINVLSPKSGEIFGQGFVLDIKWNSKNISSKIIIELRKGKTTHSVIANSVTNEDFYKWTIPSNIPVSNEYKIRIYDEINKLVYGESEGVFSVVSTATGTHYQASASNTEGSRNINALTKIKYAGNYLTSELTVSSNGESYVLWPLAIIEQNENFGKVTKLEPLNKCTVFPVDASFLKTYGNDGYIKLSKYEDLIANYSIDRSEIEKHLEYTERNLLKISMMISLVRDSIKYIGEKQKLGEKSLPVNADIIPTGGFYEEVMFFDSPTPNESYIGYTADVINSCVAFENNSKQVLRIGENKILNTNVYKSCGQNENRKATNLRIFIKEALGWSSAQILKTMGLWYIGINTPGPIEDFVFIPNDSISSENMNKEVFKLINREISLGQCVTNVSAEKINGGQIKVGINNENGVTFTPDFSQTGKVFKILLGHNTKKLNELLKKEEELTNKIASYKVAIKSLKTKIRIQEEKRSEFLQNI